MEKVEIVTHYLETFREFLARNWDLICRLAGLDNTGSFAIDWQQGNWERMVEHLLASRYGPLHLMVYGDGADVNGESSRVCFPEALPTHSIKCQGRTSTCRDVLNSEDISLKSQLPDFDRFVTMVDGWYVEKDPFDFVLFSMGNMERVVSVREVDFVLARI